jgi:putative hydrolase of the HAD superfamily
MPGWDAALGPLRNDFLLGIISNAQFFTPLLFPALLGHPLDELGFSAEMQYFSYQVGCAKPSPRLFDDALRALARQGIRPDQTVYIGNDMLNDISVPAAMGVRTVLFAGDLRSLRWRDDDPRVGAHAPDAVITNLAQLPECLC